MNERVLIILILIIFVIVGPISLTTGNSDESALEETVVDSNGITHKVTFIKSNSTVIVDTKNPTEWEDKIIGYGIRVDGQRVHDADFRLDQNEQRAQKINITPGINVNQNEHTVSFYTYGNSTQFNFTREIDSADSGEIPTPYISNVEVADGTIHGEPSAVANVTLVNPSKQIYSTKLFVHTVGTDGSLYPASVRPESSRTITVELLDDRGSKIAGEARLYTGNMTTKDGAMDQVEFAGQADAETNVWNVSYEPARPTWMEDNYQYRNDSYTRGYAEKLSDGHEVAGLPAIYVVVGLLVGGWTVRKSR